MQFKDQQSLQREEEEEEEEVGLDGWVKQDFHTGDQGLYPSWEQ